MKLIELRNRKSNDMPLKAFADMQLSDGTVIRDFRISQETGRRPCVVCPQLSWKDPQTDKIKYKTVVTFPDQIKGQIDFLVLTAWTREKKKRDGKNQ